MSQPSQELFRDLVEFAPDALILVGADGVILYANTHAHTLFGYAAGQLSGVSIELLIPEESRGQHTAHRTAYRDRPSLREMGNRNMPLFGLRRDGTRFRAEIRLAPVKTAQGYVAAAAVRDATESVQFMSMLAAARQAAEEANEAKGRLLAAASHDLRQPMQTLRLLNGAMKRLTSDPNMKDALLQEERALNTMSELLHALLSIAKLESGSLQPNLTDVSLSAVFEDLRQQFAALAKLKQLPEGVGTRFSLDLTTRAQPRADATERSGVTAHHRGQRILLVEDDRSMRDALRTYLRLDQHEVHTAGSLTELAEVLTTLPGPPSILISDFHLGPSERGSEAIERVRSHYQRIIPAILLTGDTSAVPARFSSEAGVRVLNKPVDAQRLVSLMDELLQAHHAG